MPSPAVTYTFSNSTTADATQVNQNFTDIINSLTDATKDLSINALTAAGNVTFTGTTITFGNATSDSVVFTALIGSHMSPSAHNTYDLGTVTTLGYRALFLASSSATKTAKLLGPAISSDIIVTLPASTGTLGRNAAAMTIQRLTSGTGATYTLPSGCIAIKVRMVGGGGGGGGSGTTAGSAAGGGTDTLWKDAAGSTTIVTAAAGSGGPFGGIGGAGGAATINSPAVTINSITGSAGGAGGISLAATTSGLPAGGSGGASVFGGAGTGGTNGSNSGSPTAGATNSGSGGGGGGATNANSNAGAGGGSGAYAEFLITAPTSTYTYTVGASGSAGGAGGGGAAQAGGAGAAGVIVVEEFY